jgi:hypothetical protein
VVATVITHTTTETSDSGAVAGMPLRILRSEGLVLLAVAAAVRSLAGGFQEIRQSREGQGG